MCAMITIEKILADKPEMIFYGANTCWWTHRAEDLRQVFPTGGPPGLPCDPLGGMLMQTDDIDGFLSSAQEKVEHYGKHGIDAFLAAHHSSGIGPFRGWEKYNEALDDFADTQESGQ